MVCLKNFLQDERTSLQKLSTDFSPEYREQVMRSFIESPLLPGGSFNLLLLAEGTSSAELLQNLALSAYDRFVSCYLEQVSNYAAHTVGEFSGEDVRTLSGQVTWLEQMDRLLELFEEARSDDPVLEWFINEGASTLNEVRKSLNVKDVKGLAALIHQFDYYLLFFPSDSGEVESYSFIVDLPERVASELADLGLLEVKRERDFLISVHLDPNDYSKQWAQGFIQLVDWQSSILEIETKQAESIAEHVEEWIPGAANQQKSLRTSQFRLPPSSDKPAIEIGFEYVNLKIETTETDRGNLDEEDTCIAPGAVA